MAGKLTGKQRLVIAAGLYPFGLLLAAFSYLVTRGQDGDLILMFWLFGASGIFYALLLTASTARAFTWHSVAHLVVYETLCLCAAGYDTHLEEMAGMLPVLIMYLVAAMVIAGIVVNAIATALSRRRDRAT